MQFETRDLAIAADHARFSLGGMSLATVGAISQSDGGHQMKKSLSWAILALILTVFLAPALASAQAVGGAGLTVPVTGTAAGAGRITGSFTILKFVDTGDATNPVGALGTLVLRTANGRNIVTQVTMPVKLSSSGVAPAAQQAVIQQLVCEVLELTLGPLDLNLLGLEVHLDQVHLTIDANPAGGLLGQLLCSIANLLGPGGTITNLIQLLTLLNQLLGLLGGLGL